MSKPSLLVADADPRSLRILDVALRKAGFLVETATDGAEALRHIRRAPHDLVLADVALPGLDGMALVRAVRSDPALAGLPVLLMGAERDAHSRAVALEAGADDFLGKPLLIKDLTTRIRMLLVEKDQRRLAEKGTPAALTGTVADLGLVDLFQTLESWRRSGVVFCSWGDKVAEVWVVDGQAIDAQYGALAGEAAFYRLINWEGGTFRVEFGPVDRQHRIELGTQGLLLEAMRRVDEIGRIAELLPLSTRLAVEFGELVRRLADLPDEVNGVLRQFDGLRTLADVLERSPLDELSTLAVVQRLLDEKVLVRSEAVTKPPSKPSLTQWLGPASPVSSPPAGGAGRPKAPGLVAPDGPTSPGVPLSLLLSPESEPVAPLAPGSQPPVPAQAAEPESVPTPALPTGKGKKKKGKQEAPVPGPEAALPQQELLRAFAPAAGAGAAKVEAPPAALVEETSQKVEAIFAKAELDQTLQNATPVLGPSSAAEPAAPERNTAAFKLPAEPKKAVPFVRFPPLRGVRRERLRKEAEEARSALDTRQPVRLSHVVELPSWPVGESLAKRRISPATSDAAKRFAPDVPVASLGDLAAVRSGTGPGGAAHDQALATPPEGLRVGAAAEVKPDAWAALAAKGPQAAAGPSLLADATTTPGHRIEGGDAPPAPAVAAAPAAEAPQPAQPAPQPAAAAVPAVQVATPVEPRAVLVPDREELARPDDPTQPRAMPPDAPAPAPTAAREPEIAAPPKPARPVEKAAAPHEDDFDRELRAALGKGKKPRWPVYAGSAAIALLGIWFLASQPKTDKEGRAFLDSARVAKEPAAKVAPPRAVSTPTPVPPLATASPDAGLAVAPPDAGPALAAVPPPAEPVVDAGTPAAAGGDAYAGALAAGEALIKRGKYKAAIVELKKASGLNPESVPALLELGDAYLEADQPRSAIKPLEKAARLDARSGRAQLLLGTAFQSLGKNGDATKAYQKYLELEPTGEYARDVRAILANLKP